MDDLARRRAQATAVRHGYTYASDAELTALRKEFLDDWALLQADYMLGNYTDPESIEKQIQYTEWNLQAVEHAMHRRLIAGIKRPDLQPDHRWTARFDAMRQRNIVEGLGLLGLPLAKRGREWKASCPFHDDDTPSLSVNEEKGVWTCYSCHRGGDLVEYVAHLYGKSKGEALEYLEMIFSSIASGSLARPEEDDRDKVDEDANQGPYFYQVKREEPPHQDRGIPGSVVPRPALRIVH